MAVAVGVMGVTVSVCMIVAMGMAGLGVALGNVHIKLNALDARFVPAGCVEVITVEPKFGKLLFTYTMAAIRLKRESMRAKG